MKKLMVIVVFAGIAIGANAQTTKQESKKEKSKTETNSKSYTCSKCGTKYDKAGQCCGAPLTLTETKETPVQLKDHVCNGACKDGKHVYAHGEKGHVCTPECKTKM